MHYLQSKKWEKQAYLTQLALYLFSRQGFLSDLRSTKITGAHLISKQIQEKIRVLFVTNRLRWRRGSLRLQALTLNLSWGKHPRLEIWSMHRALCLTLLTHQLLGNESLICGITQFIWCNFLSQIQKLIWNRFCLRDFLVYHRCLTLWGGFLESLFFLSQFGRTLGFVSAQSILAVVLVIAVAASKRPKMNTRSKIISMEPIDL